MSESPSNQRLLPNLGIKNGDVKIEVREADYLKPKQHLSLFSKKIGVSDGLGLQECMATINYGQEDELQVWAYKNNRFRLLLTLLAILCTGVLPLGLALYWYRHWWVVLSKQQCTLEEAETVIVIDHYKGLHTTRYVKSVYRQLHEEADMVVPVSGGSGYRTVRDFRWFSCKKNRYFWDVQEAAFVKVEGLDRGITLAGLRSYQGGLSQAEGSRRAALYGTNEIIVPLENLGVLMVKEILSPFYVFQIFSISFWYADDYWMYATAILVTSVVSLTSALYQTRTNQQNLRDTIVSSEMVVRLREGGTKEQVLSSELVPGDVIVVPDHGCQLLCDAVLLSGSVIMNESMLTGESVPVTKTALLKASSEDVVYCNKAHEKSSLKCGTMVIQTRKAGQEQVTAVVIRTGYSTSKGDLVRSILYPPPVDFQFEKDSYKFIIILALIATVGMVYTLTKMVIDGEDATDIILEVFDLITIVVPPALPAAMTIGIVLANQRLIPKNIFCISPRTINVAGTTDCVCFDKTGTITEDGMDMWGVVPVTAGLAPLQGHSSTVGAGAGGGSAMGWTEPVSNVSHLPARSQLRMGMATCHELNIVEGSILGDPLDEKMFLSTEWTLELVGEEVSQADRLQMPYMKSPVTPEDSVLQAAPLKLFPFSSDLQRMTVVTNIIEDHEEGFSQPATYVFCKGSPEKVEGMCNASTLPSDYRVVLNTYTRKGYRIIALAGRALPPSMAKHSRLSKLTREQAEDNLTFLGLVVLENRLKPVSSAVLRELQGAKIRTVMVTGDNILTAVSVAKDCGLVPQGERVIQCLAEETKSGESVVRYIALQEDKVVTGPDAASLDVEPAFHLAIEGPSFEVVCDNMRDSVLPFLATRGAVFARMRPDMKQRLVEILQDLDFVVIMCGDGANDCGALKAANAGISLSEAEASVAAPFTSKTPDISCVPALIRESRAALVTSFGIFKYMAGYSITQFVSVMILYNIYSNLSDFQFVYIDLFLITTMAALFGFNRAYTGPLAPSPPISALFSVLPVFSLLSQLAIAIGVQVGVLFYTKSQPWFVGFDYKNACYRNTSLEASFNETGIIKYWGEEVCTEDEDPVASLENFAIFAVSQFQYIILVIVFSKGAPYRESIFKNRPLLVDMVILGAFSLFLTLNPDAWQACSNYFMLFPPPDDLGYRFFLVGVVVFNLLLSLFTETVLSDKLVRKVTTKKDKAYELVNKELRKQPQWPPLSPPTEGSSSSSTDQSSSKDSQVIVMETDQAQSSEQAFNSLFNTPSSSIHSAAAVSLNPSTATPQKRSIVPDGQEAELTLASPLRKPTRTDRSSAASPKFSTAHPSPVTSGSPSSLVGETSSCSAPYVSCDRLDSSPEVVSR